MPTSAANSSSEKRAMSAAQTQPAQLQSSPSVGSNPNKVCTRSAADAQAQVKQSSKYNNARTFLSTYHLLTENALCTAQAIVGVLHLKAKRYRMPDNVTKALGHVTEAIQCIDHQTQKCESTNSIPRLIKGLQSSLSTEIDRKLGTLKKRLTMPPLHRKSWSQQPKK
jgi:hypothetical protein